MHFFIYFLTGVVLFSAFQYFPFSTTSLSLLSAGYLSIKRMFSAILFLLLGTAFALIRYEPAQDIPYIKDRIAVNGVFESCPVKNDQGMYRQAFRIHSAVNMNDGGRLNEIDGREMTLFSDREFVTGREYDLALKFLKSGKRLNPGQPVRDDLYANFLEILRSGNTKKTIAMKVEECRFRINRYIEGNFGKDSGAFVESITTGQTAGLDDKLRDAFNVSGLAHILSISGTHFGLLSVILFGISRLAVIALPYRVLQRLTIYLTPSQAAAILCVPFMTAYLGLSGASIPAIRSFVMISLFLIGLIIGRKGFWLNSLLLAAFLIVIWDPEAVFSLSFQLSFLAVLSIGFSIQKKEDEKKEGRKVFRYMKDALLMTLAASAGTAPLVAYHFHYLSVISPLSNLIIAPLIGFALIPLSVVSSFLYLLSGHFVFTPIVSAIADISIFMVKLFSRIPYAGINIPAFPPILAFFFYGGFIFYFLLKRKPLALVISFLPILMYLSMTICEKDTLSITFLDVGQGDASVIELPDGKTIVVDTGKTGREAAAFLKYRGKNTVNALVTSHVHPDHTGGLDYIAGRCRVNEIWDNGRIVIPETFNSMTHATLNRGDAIEGKGYRIYVLHPYPEFYTMRGNEYDAANNDSLILKIEGNHTSILFAGDIEEEAEENIMHLGKWLRSDVMKIPHHGGRSSAYEPFFKTVSPDIAVISAGRDNSFGHPHQETLDALNGVRIFRTDADGAMKIREEAEGYQIKTYKDFQFQKAYSLPEEINNIKRLFKTW